MTPDQINEFFSFLYEGRTGMITFWLRLAAGVITSALAAAIIVVTLKFRQLSSKPPPAPAHTGQTGRGAEAAQPWREVSEKISSSNPADWNLAVIKADAILDEVLKGMGIPGVTFGDRLKQLDRSRLSTLDGAWEAHKLRNRIAHESAQALAYAEARRAVMLYAGTLKELGYLEE